MSRRIHRRLLAAPAALAACWLLACDSNPVSSPDCIPLQLTPTVGATLDNGCFDHTDPLLWQFTWGACDDATAYHLFVTHEAAMLPVVDRDGLRSTSFTHFNDAFVLDYKLKGWHWSVRAQVRNQWGAWSPRQRFVVEPRDTDCSQSRESLDRS